MKNRTRPLVRTIIGVALFAVVIAGQLRAEPNWPQFRGPGARGIAASDGLPERWSATQNVEWKIDVPGRGWGSPIVWGDRLFLTTVVNLGESEEPKKGLYFGGNRPDPPEPMHQWKVLCLELASGRLLWERQVREGRPESSIHLKNSFASETPVTDGKHVYAYFGNVGIFCFDFAGKLVWSKEVEVQPTRFGWGTAASPVLHGDRLYLVNDNQQDSYLLALDKTTGKEIWRVARDEKSNWATPYIWQNSERTEIVTPGTGKVRSYDLDGNLLWWLEGTSSITIATPYASDGLLYISAGYVLDPSRPIYAIRPGATGDISLEEDQDANQWIAWRQKQAAPYNPSTLVYEDRMYVLYDRGFFACFDPNDGTEIYRRKRISGGRAFTSSPWACAGKVYCLNEDGVTFVFKAGDEFELLHTNSLAEDDMCMATAALASDRLLIRTAARVYCIRDGATSDTKAAGVAASSGTAEHAPASAAYCELAAAYSKGHNGLSMLVMVDDKTVFEQYHHGHGPDKVHRLASGTKSFWGVAAVCAAEDGLLTLDEKVSDTIGAWKSDPRKSQITIRHLLTFTSGLDPTNDVLRGPAAENKFAYALQVATKAAAGETFAYGASHLFAFGEVLRRKLEAAGTDESPLDYLTRRVLDPIGLDVGQWTHDAAGNPQMPFGAFLTARQWAKLGTLVLHQGRWQGSQVVPAARLAECFRGTKANPIYGLNWWLIGLDSRHAAEGPQVPKDVVAAMGAGKQRLYVIPSLNMVVVRQGEGTQFDDREFLLRLLYGKASLPDALPSPAPAPLSRRIPWFAGMDRDGNGRLTVDEIPPRLHERVLAADADGDGAVTRQEIIDATSGAADSTSGRD